MFWSEQQISVLNWDLATNYELCYWAVCTFAVYSHTDLWHTSSVLIFPELAASCVKSISPGEHTCQHTDQNDWPLSQVARVLWGTERREHFGSHGGFHRWSYRVLWIVWWSHRALQDHEECAGERLTDGLLHRCMCLRLKHQSLSCFFHFKC